MKLHHLSYLCIFLIAPLWRALPDDSIGNVFMKSALMERLDSIDMEKQIRKRKGQSLEDLEKKSLLLKDSITALKMGINRTDVTRATPKPSAGAALRLGQVSRFLPRNAFDWVVFVFAAIALIAGAILCIGLISMLWKTITSNKKTPLKTMRENLSLREEHTPAPDVLSKNSGKNTDVLDKGIDSLKKRISKASENSGNPWGGALSGSAPKSPQEPAVQADIHKGSNALETTPVSSAKQSAPQAAHDLKSLILQAAREGADTMEISKKFHVGVDQVTLILRVANRDNANNH